MLLLFDIDGTLVSGATTAHRQALHRALSEVHGIDPEKFGHTVSPAGRTDGEIARGILLAAGVSAQRIDDRADEVRMRCCTLYAQICTDDLSHTVLPGIVEVLEWLSGLEDVRLGLLTGNFEPVARLKLRRAGIGRFFPIGQGAFGSDSEDRTDLPAIARRRAGSDGTPYPRKHTIIIGDTPRDIACARADGVRVVAISTGPYGFDDLSDADAVVHNGPELHAELAIELEHPSPLPPRPEELI